MAGWGSFIGKIFDWFPGRRESYLNEISNLQRENDDLQKKIPFTIQDSARYTVNADRIKLLREKISRIT